MWFVGMRKIRRHFRSTQNTCVLRVRKRLVYSVHRNNPMPSHLCNKKMNIYICHFERSEEFKMGLKKLRSKEIKELFKETEMQNRINILDKNTINQIAAGEVIDRPASIIKELVENSIDAGATSVSIEIRGGGIDLIRITDNGCGINRDDVKVAFVRHSTSKINNAEDLSYITSLGFRGEALASIAAVADVELITKQKEAFSAVRYRISGGEEKEFEEIGAPDGTTFIIRDVFGCVPVRRKFLKSSATEGSYCNEAVERIALSHPGISIKYVNNGRNVLYTNGSGRMRDVIFGIYGRDIASEIAELSFEGKNGIKISGCICKPTIVRNNRNTENTFVNGRFIKSPILFKAIEDAYQPYLMQHKYPFTALYVEINPANMDVNVHPTKQEVRFENPEAVYNTVFEAVTEMLSGKALIHRAEPEENKSDNKDKNKYIPEPFETGRKKEETGKNASDTLTVAENHEESENKNTQFTVRTVSSVNPAGKYIKENTIKENIIKSFEAQKEAAGKTETKSDSAIGIISETLKINDNNIDKLLDNTIVKSEETKDNAEENTEYKASDSSNEITAEITADITAASPSGKYVQQTLFDNAVHIESRDEFNNIFSKGYRIVGQIFETYWIIECGGCAYIIDQHAAHEKILYEKFMKEVGTEEATQLLSPPIIISLTGIEEATAEQYKDELSKNGFVLEHFGGHEYALSEVPLNLYGIDAKAFLLELLDELAKDIKGSVIKGIKEKIATCACKAAVKGNMELSFLEAEELIKQLLKAENPFNCPHGRPIIIDITKKEIEKKFKRIL